MTLSFHSSQKTFKHRRWSFKNPRWSFKTRREVFKNRCWSFKNRRWSFKTRCWSFSDRCWSFKHRRWSFHPVAKDGEIWHKQPGIFKQDIKVNDVMFTPSLKKMHRVGNDFHTDVNFHWGYRCWSFKHRRWSFHPFEKDGEIWHKRPGIWKYKKIHRFGNDFHTDVNFLEFEQKFTLHISTESKVNDVMFCLPTRYKRKWFSCQRFYPVAKENEASVDWQWFS